MFCASLLGAKRRLQPSSRWAVAVAAAFAVLGLALMGKGAAIHAKAIVAQYLLQQAFAESLATGQPVKPWGWADTWPVARLEVPRLGASAIVLKGGSGQAMAFGPGLLENTPQPGDEGAAVIAAHRDTHFAFLRDVKLGDEIQITRQDGAIFWFRITEKAVVRWDASGIDPRMDGRWLVLSTCWPLDAMTPGDMRLVVRAQMTGRQTSQRMKAGPAPL
jgi:sortase A